MRERSIKRKVDKRSPLPSILVFCEGTKTERQYLVGLRQRFRLASLRIGEQTGVPVTLVRCAVRAKADERPDHVWCVMDVDDHPNLANALNRAKANGISCALSNPCFELWLLWHFAEHTAYIDRKRALKMLVKYVPDYDKGVDFSKFEPGIDGAKDRSRAQRKRHKSSGDEESSNPSSGMHELVQLIQDSVARDR